MTGGRELHATPCKVKSKKEKGRTKHDFLGGVSETFTPSIQV